MSHLTSRGQEIDVRSTDLILSSFQVHDTWISLYLADPKMSKTAPSPCVLLHVKKVSGLKSVSSYPSFEISTAVIATLPSLDNIESNTLTAPSDFGVVERRRQKTERKSRTESCCTFSPMNWKKMWSFEIFDLLMAAGKMIQYRIAVGTLKRRRHKAWTIQVRDPTWVVGPVV